MAPSIVLGKLEDSAPTLVELLTLLAVTPDDFCPHLDGPSLPLLGMLVFLMFFPVLGSSNARGCSVIPVLVPAPWGWPSLWEDSCPDFLQESWDGPDSFSLKTDGKKGLREGKKICVLKR